MADLSYYAYLPRVRPIKNEDYEPFNDVAFDLSELIQLKEMNTAELRGLMMFCDIRVYNDLPVIACTDDEMRLAYLSWRAFKSADNRILLQRKLSRLKKRLFKTYDGVVDWFNGWGGDKVKTLIDLGKKCFVHGRTFDGGFNRLVICPDCESRNVVMIANDTEYVDCLGCKEIRIKLKKVGADE